MKSFLVLNCKIFCGELPTGQELRGAECILNNIAPLFSLIFPIFLSLYSNIYYELTIPYTILEDKDTTANKTQSELTVQNLQGQGVLSRGTGGLSDGASKEYVSPSSLAFPVGIQDLQPLNGCQDVCSTFQCEIPGRS